MFGPPSGVTRSSSWPWIDRRVSGLRHPTGRPFRTRFRYGSASRLNLAGHRNSQAHYAKGTRWHVHPEGCIVRSRLVDTRFQGLFTPLAGVLFAFPSRYWFTIGRQVVCSLGRWSSRIPTGFLEPRGTQVPSRASHRFTYAAVTRSGWPFHAIRLQLEVPCRRPYNPEIIPNLGLGSSAFARHYLRNLWFDFFSSGY